MRFFKIFLISFFSLIGVVGAILGIMYLTGYFTEEPVSPTNISFEFQSYEVDDDFSMLITTTTPDVTERAVVLSFVGNGKNGITEQTINGVLYISDGIITVPKNVLIGQPFTVKVNTSLQTFDGNSVYWVTGGISKLKATSSNILVEPAYTSVYVDVPVYSVTVQTKFGVEETDIENTFNIGSSFWAVAVFEPAISQYKFSKDGSDGKPAVYKSVYFMSDSSAIEAQNDDTARFAQKYLAVSKADGVKIKVQAFRKSNLELNAYRMVEGLTSEQAYFEILRILDNLTEEGKVEDEGSVNFKELVVGSFSLQMANIPTKFNQRVRVFANSSELLADQFNLGITILASDLKTLLQDKIENVVIAAGVESGAGITPVTNEQFIIQGRAFVTKTLMGQTYNFYFPYKHSSNINKSYWDIYALQEGLSIKIFAMLVEEVNGEYEFSEFSFDNGSPKYVLQADSASYVSEQVSWANPSMETRTLYIYDSPIPENKIYTEFDLKTLEIIIPIENTYKEVRYFAFMEVGGIISTLPLDNYIFTTGRTVSYPLSTQGGESVTLYEIPNGILKPKEELDAGGKINVVFATVKTNALGQIIYENDTYLIDKFSSVSNVGALQAIYFDIQKTLTQLITQVAFDSELEIFESETKEYTTIPFVHGTSNAFFVKFVVSTDQKNIFIRDWNNGKININFYVDGVLNNSLFGYVKPPLTNTSPNEPLPLLIPISINNINYTINDVGYRNFTVKISYIRGTEQPIEYPVTVVGKLISETELEIIENPVLEVYDGRIKTIAFDHQVPGIINQSNPIVVETSLVKQTENGQPVFSGDKTGVYVAKNGSTNSFSKNGQSIDKNLIFNEDSNLVKIVAFDRWGKRIVPEDGQILWTLQTSDPQVISIDETGQFLSFVSSKTTPVEISISSTFGVGGKIVESTSNLFFKVQTRGKVVEVVVNPTGSGKGMVDYSNVDYDSILNNTFTLKNENSNYNKTTIDIEIDGNTGESAEKIINFYGESAILKIFYALEVSEGRYEVFDIGPLLKFSRIDETSFDTFITFNQNENDNYLYGFKITKDFGIDGYLNLKVESEIGINFILRITIKRTINASLDKFEHEGAVGAIDSGHTYQGVFAQNEITLSLTFTNAEGQPIDISSGYTPILYSAKGTTKSLIAVYNVNLGNGATVDIVDGNKVVIKFVVPDVSSFTLMDLVFVLHSSENTGITGISSNYTRLLYDYTHSIYMRVNPNIKAVLSSNPNENFVNLKTNQREVATLLAINSTSYNVINVTRIVGNADLSLDPLSSNYLIARITNSAGSITTSEYFSIENNKLVLNKAIEVNTQVYVSVFHVVNGVSYRVATFSLFVSPDIQENEEKTANFVTYNGKKYLQLIAGQIYTREQIISFFEVPEGTVNAVNANFNNNPITSPYWVITNSGGLFINIKLEPYSQILVNALSVNIVLENIGVVNFPIMISPRPAPFVLYDETETIDERGLRNQEANKDLYNLLSIDYLVNHNVYDEIEDGLTPADNVNIFANDTKRYGIYANSQETIQYQILDGEGHATQFTGISILQDGTILIDFVGQDTFVIVVANINGLKIYYRLKIKASLKLESYYPYIQNINAEYEEEIAEYVFYKSNDPSRTITITKDFDKTIPAYSEIIPNVYEEKDGEYTLTQQNITNRFMLFRNLNDMQNGKVLVNSKVQNVTIKSVELGVLNQSFRTVVPVSSHVNYVVVSNYGDTFDVLLKNTGVSYVVELEITSTNNSKTNYKFAVEVTNANYSLVIGEENQDISSMQEMPADYKITIESPILNSTTTSEVLKSIFLKLETGSSASNQTGLLKYHIIDNLNDIFSIENQIITGKYSSNSIYASLLFYTKYGPVRQIPLILQSNIKVVEKPFSGTYTEQKLSDTTLAGSVYSLVDKITFIEKGTTENYQLVDAIWTDNSIKISGDYSQFVTVGTDVNRGKIALPATNENFVLTLDVEVEINGESYNFVFTLYVNVAITPVEPSEVSVKPDDAEVYGLRFHKVSIFGKLFNKNTNLSNDINFETKISGDKTEIIGSYGYQVGNLDRFYKLELSLLNGTSAIDMPIGLDGTQNIEIKTKSVAQEITVIIKAELIFIVIIDEEEIEVARYTTYYSFVVLPENTIVFNYPQPSGETLGFESIFFEEFGSGVLLNEKPNFQENNRVVIIPSYEGAPANIYVTYSIVDGDVNVIPEDSKEITNSGSSYSPKRYEFSTSFKFNFIGKSFSYATIDFEIFVNGLSRGKYTLRVYKEISSVYQISINPINSMTGTSENFYVGEDRTDIFDDIQAFKFRVNDSSSVLLTKTTFKVYKKLEYGYSPLITTFELTALNKGQVVYVKLPEVSAIAGLNQDNIIFRLNDDNITDYTLSDLSGGMSPSLTFFQPTTFEFVRRLEVKYLGYKIYDTKFLSTIKVKDHSSNSNEQSISDFRINYNGLGGEVLERNNNAVGFYVGSVTEQNNIGTYYYNIAINLIVEYATETVKIQSGQTTTRFLDIVGVKRRDNTPFVQYPSGGNPIVDNLIKQRKLIFDLALVPIVEDYNTYNFKYITTGQTYKPNLSLGQIVYPNPLLISPVESFNEHGESYLYNFVLIANGAPNGGIYGTLRFKFSLVGESEEDTIECYVDIKVEIYPDWEISLLNMDKSQNSELNPEIINSDIFGQNSYYKYYLSSLINPDLTKVFAYKENDENRVNFASRIDLQYKVFQGAGETIENPIISNNNYEYVAVTLTKPTFAERTIIIQISDIYEYKTYFYIRVYPEEEIRYESIEMIDYFFEGDSFVLKSLYDAGEVDHLIYLSTQTLGGSDNVQVLYRLIAADKDINGDGVVNSADEIVGGLSKSTINYYGLADIVRISYLDGKLFTARNLNVYIEINLRKDLGNGNFEVYTINTSPFFLKQRYAAQVADDNQVRDNVQFDLINHLKIQDYKASNEVGSAKLFDDKTLKLTDSSFEGIISVYAYNVISSKAERNIVVPKGKANEIRYYSLSDVYNNEIPNTKEYTMLISRIERKDGENTLLKIEAFQEELKITDKQGDNVYFVILTNGFVYQSYQVTANVDSITIPAGWGIAGYEKKFTAGTVTGFAVNVAPSEEINGKPLPQRIEFSRTDEPYFDITLTNTKTIYGGVKTIRLVREKHNADKHFDVYYNDTYKGEFTFVKDGTQDDTNPSNNFYYFALQGENANWQITEIINDGVNFVVHNDKRLEVVTIEKKNSENEFQTIDVNLQVDSRPVKQIKLTVLLNYNGVQRISVLSKWSDYDWDKFDSSKISLPSTDSISESDMKVLKDMTYYNDTLNIIVEGTSYTVSGSMTVEITRQRGGATTTQTFSIPLKPYKYSFARGLSVLFGDIVKPGDVYSMKVLSLPINRPARVETIWPDGSVGVVTTDFVTGDSSRYGSYQVVEDFENVVIPQGKTTIKLDSASQFNIENANKLLPNMMRYYIIKFRGAYYVVDGVNFKVSPYYHSVDTSQVYVNNIRPITDYAQYSLGGSIQYLVDFETWAGQIGLKDSKGNIIPNDTLISKIKQLQSGEQPILSFSLHTNSGTGSGNILEDYSLSTVYSSTSSIQDTAYTVDVMVALNGEYKGAQTEWISFGTIRMFLSTNTQYYIPEKTYGGYVIMFGNENEHYLRYVETRFPGSSSEPRKLTFTANKLFAEHSVEYTNPITMSINDVQEIYLPSLTKNKYVVSYYQNNLRVETILESNVLDMPAINIAGLEPGGTINVTAVQKGVEQGLRYYASYTNNSSQALFGQIRFDQFIVQDSSQTLADITNITTEYDFILPSFAAVVGSKINLATLSANYGISFFGAGGTGNQGFISNLVYSNMFKLTKITEDTITQVTNIVPANTTHYYSITQISYGELPNHNGNGTKSFQNYVYEFKNTLQNAQKITVNLKEWIVDLNNPVLVVVERISLDEKFSKINLIGAKGYYSIDAGILDSGMFNKALTVISKQDIGNGIITFDIGDYYYIDPFNGTTVNTESDIRPALIGYALESNGNSVNYNLNTQGKFVTVVSKFNDAPLRYQYFEENQTSLIFNLQPGDENEVKTIIYPTQSSKQGSLIWHEYFDTPTEILYYLKNYTQALITDTKLLNLPENEKLVNGDIITSVWDGTMVFEGNYQSDFYVKVVYDNDVVYYASYFEYKIQNSERLRVGDMFKDSSGNNIPLDVTKFSPLTRFDGKLTSIFGAPDNRMYEINYKDNKVGVMLYNSQFELSEHNLIVNLIGNEKLIKQSDLTITEKTYEGFGWIEEAGIYAFEQEDGLFEVVIIENVEGKSYGEINMFELLNKVFISTSEKPVKYSLIKSSVSINNGTTNPEMYVKILGMVDPNNTNNNFVIRLTPSPESGYILPITDYSDLYTQLTSTTIKLVEVEDGSGVVEIPGRIYEVSVIVEGSTKTINFNWVFSNEKRPNF